jgi:rubrerythrin
MMELKRVLFYPRLFARAPVNTFIRGFAQLYRMKTRDDAITAFAGESQANRKYQAFSEKAAQEGLTNIARLFLAASEAEAIHARRLLKVLEAIGTTEENLKAAISGETNEFTEMYPGFIMDAENEKKSDAALAFTYAMKVEEVHAFLYTEALKAVKEKRDLTAKKMFICPVCGNIFFGTPPDQCPVCKAFKKVFKEIP